MRVRWLSAALTDLEDAVRSKSPDAAEPIVERTIESVYRLETFPSMGRRGRVTGTRELVVSGTPFIVPYRVKGQEIFESSPRLESGRRSSNDQRS